MIEIDDPQPGLAERLGIPPDVARRFAAVAALIREGYSVAEAVELVAVMYPVREGKMREFRQEFRVPSNLPPEDFDRYRRHLMARFVRLGAQPGTDRVECLFEDGPDRWYALTADRPNQQTGIETTA